MKNNRRVASPLVDAVDQSRERKRADNGRVASAPRSDHSPLFRAILVAIGFLLAGGGCHAPMDSIQVVLDRHKKAVAKLPEEQQNQLLPYGEAVVSSKAEVLLPEGVLTVEAAISAAVRANPDVHAAQARLEFAAARIAEARARYYPTIVFTHDSTRTFQTPASRNRLATAL